MKIELIISKYYRIILDRLEVGLHFLMMQVKTPASELAGSGDGLGIIGTPAAAETLYRTGSLYHLQGLRLCKKVAAHLSKAGPLSAARAVKN